MHGWLTRLLERRGERYLAVCLFIGIAEVNVVMVPMSVLVIGRYEGLSFSQSARTLLISGPLLLACMLIGVMSSRHHLRVLQAWCRGRRRADAALETAAAAHGMPLRFFLVSLTLGLLIPEPFGVVSTMSLVHRSDPRTFALLVIGGLFFALWGIVVLWIWLELAMRPILVSLAVTNPDVLVRPGRRFSVNAQLLIGISSATLVGACYAGALTADPGRGIDGLQDLLIVTISVSALTGVSFVALFGSLILSPVRELTSATRQVADGNLQSKIPLTTNDELGDMSESFNAMVDGLRDRIRLREENTALVEELRASRERIVTAANGARRKVEQDLHDGAQQMLVLIRLKLGLLERALDDHPDLRRAVVELRSDLDQALTDLRDLAHGIYPAILDSAGINGALKQAAERLAIPASVESTLDARFDREVELAVYFCCLEAMQNAAKHAGENAEVTVRLEAPDGALTFEVRDTGVGFDSASMPFGSGLWNLADRLGAIGGIVRVDSRVGHGTRVIGHLPLDGTRE